MIHQRLEDWTQEKIRRLLRGDPAIVQMVLASDTQGQRALVSRLHLPRQIDQLHPITWHELCERWDLRIVGNFDALFFAVEMPKGWRMHPLNEHSMWSILEDELGRERATVFYRANRPRKSATLYVRNRFDIYEHYEDPSDNTVRIICARDGQRIFREFGRVPFGGTGFFKEVERVRATARAWFAEEFPGWEDPFAYWDTDL